MGVEGGPGGGHVLSFVSAETVRSCFLACGPAARCWLHDDSALSQCAVFLCVSVCLCDSDMKTERVSNRLCILVCLFEDTFRSLAKKILFVKTRRVGLFLGPNMFRNIKPMENTLNPWIKHMINKNEYK